MNSARPVKSRFAILVLAGLLAIGCTRDRNDQAANAGQPSPGSANSAMAPSSQDSQRIWVGLLPCSDCQGIDTRLVLSTHGGHRDYQLIETYLGGAGGKNVFNREGVWAELSEPGDGQPLTVYVLDPEQAAQRFALQPDGALQLLEGKENQPSEALAYRLQRL